MEAATEPQEPSLSTPAAGDQTEGGCSKSARDPPERWGEFFTSRGGVGGKGIKRHPSTGEEVTIRSTSRFSPPARGFGTSRNPPRAHSPDDIFPPAENTSRKGRSLVLERGGSGGRRLHSMSGTKQEKHAAAADTKGLWPLVVGLQGEPQGQRNQASAAQPESAARSSSEWSDWFRDRHQFCKDGTESGENESNSSEENYFGPVQRRRLSEDVDLPDIAQPPPRDMSFSFCPPGVRAERSTSQNQTPPEPPLDTPFTFTPPPRLSERVRTAPSTVASMETDSPPRFASESSPPPPRVPRALSPPEPSLMAESDSGDDYMPSLLAPPPLPPPHFGLPPPAPRSYSPLNRRGQTGTPPSRGGPRSSIGPIGRPQTSSAASWLHNRGPAWEGFSESERALHRQREPVSDGGQPFVDDGVGAMFSHAQVPGPPFELLPLPREPGSFGTGSPPRADSDRGSPPSLFDSSSALRQLRRLSPREVPREENENRGPLLLRERLPPRLEGHNTPPEERTRDLFDWNAYEEQDMDWWDVHSRGGAPERRARSPPRRLNWLEEPTWESGSASLEEGEAAPPQQQPPNGGEERRTLLRRRRFSLFEEEAGGAHARPRALTLLDDEAPSLGGRLPRASRGGEEERAARHRGRSWLREVNALEAGGARAGARTSREGGASGLLGPRRTGGALRPETETVLGRPPMYRNLREFLSEGGGNPTVVRRTVPAASENRPAESAAAGRGLAAHLRRAADEDGEAALGRARARRARMFEVGREGLPAPLLAMLSALEEAEQAQDLSGDQLIRLQIALAGGGMSARRRRELDAMRVDVDRMTYEELLELEERIGNVSVGLSPETVVEKLPVTKWQAPTSDGEKIKCVVCQLEYEESEDVRILPCKHCYHADCIKSWLATKNECPVCKAKAVP